MISTAYLNEKLGWEQEPFFVLSDTIFRLREKVGIVKELKCMLFLESRFAYWKPDVPSKCFRLFLLS